MGKKVDILYAEDDPKMAQLVKDALEEYEFSVRIVSDGRVAWDVFRSTPPDILLLDLEMPERNGLELVKLAHKENNRMPIVFYSSYMNVREELEAHRLGACDCVRKGGTLELLVEKLRGIYRRMTQDEQDPQVYFLSGMIRYNAPAGILKINGKPMPLKTKDARLLQLLCLRFHEIAGYDFLIRGIWGNFGYAEKGDALRNSITRLRRILAVDSSLVVDNKFGEGYMLTSKE